MTLFPYNPQLRRFLCDIQTQSEPNQTPKNVSCVFSTDVALKFDEGHENGMKMSLTNVTGSDKKNNIKKTNTPPYDLKTVRET